jgi:hypothetical protein
MFFTLIPINLQGLFRMNKKNSRSTYFYADRIAIDFLTKSLKTLLEPISLKLTLQHPTNNTFQTVNWQKRVQNTIVKKK